MALTQVNLSNIVTSTLPVANGGTGSTSLSGANLAVTNATNTFTVDQSISGLTVGKGAGSVVTNTAVGVSALGANTSGLANTAMGAAVMASNTTGGYNSAYGRNALGSNTTGSNNTALGYNALVSGTTGGNNTAVGHSALLNNTTADSNTAVGYQAGYSNTTGNQHTYLGYQAGYSQATNYYCTAVGYRAGYTNTGNYLTAFGNQALELNTTGRNTGIGNVALSKNTTGDLNTAVGDNAMVNNTTGSNNTAQGFQALQANTTASYNTAVGYQAGYANTTGTGNLFVGKQAGSATTTGSYNTFVGGGVNGSGESITTGTKNTILGSYSGNQGGLDIRTASNRIVLSDGDGNPKMFYDGSTWNFAAAAGTNLNNVSVDNAQMYGYPDNTFKCGYPSYRWTAVYAVNGTIQTSDATQKQQIRSLDEKELAVAKRIKGLIKTFKWNSSVAEKGNDARIHVGVIAQEVQAAFIAEGLDPSRYGMFCSDSWYAVDGDAGRPSDPYTADTEGAVLITQLGVRYDQLLAFVVSAL